MIDALKGLRYAVQYRRKNEGVAWVTMAAFDVEGAADSYFRRQESEFWEYRMIEIPDEE